MILKINKGLKAIVDEQDMREIAKYKWYAVHKKGTTYVARTVYNKLNKPRTKRQYLHNLILPATKGYVTDHIDGNALDNRRCNLRLATKSQNASNSKLSSKNTSGFRGVTWNKNANKWLVQIKKDSKSVYLGLFDDINEAAEAYKTAAELYFGEFNRKIA